jgi:ferrous iron transporter FeoB
MTIELGDLNIGERGVVKGFKRGNIAHRQKLLSRGLTPGAEFTVVRVAPFGDPIEVLVGNTSISMRKNEVADLLIERIYAEADADADQNYPLTIAIIGNPNCGKSTLFNGLTGAHQRVGNWAGVTVEKKVGGFRVAEQQIQVVDLPGIYSLDTYEESTSIDEKIARDYILSGEADLIVNIVDTSHFEHHLYLTTQLLEMHVPLVVVLNIMEEAQGSEAEIDVETVRRRLGCPVMAVVATQRRDVDRLKTEFQRLALERPQPDFIINYPPLIEEGISTLSPLIRKISEISHLDDRWLAVRLLEGDDFATRQVGREVKAVRETYAERIAQETGEEVDVQVAGSRYHFTHAVAAEVQPRQTNPGTNESARIDKVVLNRFLGIPVFLGVMYCLFFLTMQLGKAFKPFFIQLSNSLFVEGFGHLLGALHFPAWLNVVLANGLGGGIVQVANFIPILWFLYFFISILEESGYMARAGFVMDRLMRSLGLPGNAFIPMVVGFGCNVPAIMSTRTLDRPRDRIMAVLLSPFMSCGGRLVVYTIVAEAFFQENGYIVVFGLYVIGIVLAMITALFLKQGLLPEESSLHVLELPYYHIPKLRNVLINTWVRVKAFIVRVGKFIIPMVLVLKVLSAWGIDGSFNQQPIDQSLLAAGGRAITPILAPMGIHEEQWPATVALLTGTLHKVVIVSTLQSIYLEMNPMHMSSTEQGFDLMGKIKQAALTIPQNLQAMLGLGQAVHMHEFHKRLLLPELANRFDGKVGAFSYLILVLCYPCIATTAATTRETNRRWMGLMVFWTISLGYGLAVLFYQAGTFILHPFSSTAWILGVAAYFILLGVASLYIEKWIKREPTGTGANVEGSACC